MTEFRYLKTIDSKGDFDLSLQYRTVMSENIVTEWQNVPVVEISVTEQKEIV